MAPVQRQKRSFRAEQELCKLIKEWPRAVDCEGGSDLKFPPPNYTINCCRRRCAEEDCVRQTKFVEKFMPQISITFRKNMTLGPEHGPVRERETAVFSDFSECAERAESGLGLDALFHALVSMPTTAAAHLTATG